MFHAVADGSVAVGSSGQLTGSGRFALWCLWPGGGFAKHLSDVRPGPADSAAVAAKGGPSWRVVIGEDDLFYRNNLMDRLLAPLENAWAVRVNPLKESS